MKWTKVEQLKPQVGHLYLMSFIIERTNPEHNAKCIGQYCKDGSLVDPLDGVEIANWDGREVDWVMEVPEIPMNEFDY